MSDKLTVGSSVVLKSGCSHNAMGGLNTYYLNEQGYKGEELTIIDTIFMPSSGRRFGVVKLPKGDRILINEKDIY